MALRLRSTIANYALICAAACACSKKEPPPPKRTAPWPAREQPEAAPARALVTRFAIDARTDVRFELKAKDNTPRGALRVARGEIEVDLLDLKRSRGTVSVDVASALMEAEDAELARENTRRAHSWLDVGSSRPEAERDRLRWATFTLQGLEKVSAEAAHEGQRVKAPGADGGNPTEPDNAADGTAAEVRAVTLTARGQLLLHGFRVEQSVDLRVLFFYPVPATPGARPARIVIQTRRPLVVSLKAHDIKPRDDTGVFLAQDAKVLGREVGTSAQVHLDLSAKPLP
jgi:hypothetical protein